MKQQIEEITFLRSLAIVIVMFTHLHDYVDVEWLWKIYPFISNVSLFVFISGYCLALGKKIDDSESLLFFFKRKAIRIYSLYIPALIIFTVLYSNPLENKLVLFFDHLFGLQLFLTKSITPFFTIWYIGLIIPYYIIYGLCDYINRINRKRSDRNLVQSIVRNTSFLLIILYGIVVILNAFSLFPSFDYRLIYYFPALISGVIFSERGIFSHRPFKLRTFLFITIPSLILVTLIYYARSTGRLTFISALLNNAVGMIYNCLLPLSIAFVIHRIILYKRIPELIKKISYASYAIYLFHRPILTGVKVLLTYLKIENPNILLPLYTLFIIPFLVFPISYGIQKSAESLTRKYIFRKSDRTVIKIKVLLGIIDDQTKETTDRLEHS